MSDAASKYREPKVQDDDEDDLDDLDGAPPLLFRGLFFFG